MKVKQTKKYMNRQYDRKKNELKKTTILALGKTPLQQKSTREILSSSSLASFSSHWQTFSPLFSPLRQNITPLPCSCISKHGLATAPLQLHVRAQRRGPSVNRQGSPTPSKYDEKSFKITSPGPFTTKGGLQKVIVLI